MAHGNVPWGASLGSQEFLGPFCKLLGNCCSAPLVSTPGAPEMESGEADRPQSRPSQGSRVMSRLWHSVQPLRGTYWKLCIQEPGARRFLLFQTSSLISMCFGDLWKLAACLTVDVFLPVFGESGVRRINSQACGLSWLRGGLNPRVLTENKTYKNPVQKMTEGGDSSLCKMN